MRARLRRPWLSAGRYEQAARRPESRRARAAYRGSVRGQVLRGFRRRSDQGRATGRGRSAAAVADPAPGYVAVVVRAEPQQEISDGEPARKGWPGNRAAAGEER